MKTIKIISVIMTVLLICFTTFAGGTHEGDFELTVDFNSIVISPRVLGSELEAAFYYETDEPGYDSPVGRFPYPSDVGFNILDALKLWNGSGFDALNPVTQETMMVYFLAQSATTSTGFVPGFGLPVSSDGAWHKHLNYWLLGTGGSGTPSDGIYLLELEIYSTSTDPNIEDSYPIFIAFNLNRPEPEHEQAVEWVHENLAQAECMQDITADISGDCKVDFLDFAMMASAWLDCNLRPEDECW